MQGNQQEARLLLQGWLSLPFVGGLHFSFPQKGWVGGVVSNLPTRARGLTLDQFDAAARCCLADLLAGPADWWRGFFGDARALPTAEGRPAQFAQVNQNELCGQV